MRLTVSLLASTVLLGATPASGGDGVWRVDPDASLTRLRADGSVAWRFDYGPTRTHAFFHPLAPAGRRALTVDAPRDHVHHHGLWFSWKLINGVNFWEHAPGSDRPAGRTVWTTPAFELDDDGSARIEMTLGYQLPDETTLLTERRVIDIVSVDETGAIVIDWSARFEAVADEVLLDRTPLPGEPGGQVFGGYAGLSLRMVQLDDRSAMTLDGEVVFNTQQRYRGRSHAFAYNGSLHGEPVGVAILVDPSGLNSPSPWYAIRSTAMTFVTPAVLCYGPHAMTRGDRFDLAYRIILRPERWTARMLTEAHEAFTAHTTAAPRSNGAGQ